MRGVQLTQPLSKPGLQDAARVQHIQMVLKCGAAVLRGLTAAFADAAADANLAKPGPFVYSV